MPPAPAFEPAATGLLQDIIGGFEIESPGPVEPEEQTRVALGDGPLAGVVMPEAIAPPTARRHGRPLTSPGALVGLAMMVSPLLWGLRGASRRWLEERRRQV